MDASTANALTAELPRGVDLSRVRPLPRLLGTALLPKQKRLCVITKQEEKQVVLYLFAKKSKGTLLLVSAVLKSAKLPPTPLHLYQHHHGVARDASVFPERVHFFVRLRLDVHHAFVAPEHFAQVGFNQRLVRRYLGALRDDRAVDVSDFIA